MIRASSSKTGSGISLLAVPEDPAHADELADPHQAPGEHLGIALRDLARVHRLPAGPRRSRSVSRS